MRIRTQKDVDRLEMQIKTELGVDVSKYRDEEVVEKFVELLVFPQYVITWVIRPVLFFILLYFLGFGTLDLVHIEYVIYAVLGIGLFMASGLFLGLIFFLAKMRDDMWGIIEYSIGIMRGAILDLKQANLNVNAQNRKDKLGLLFKGVIHIVTIPLISKAIAHKAPYFGRIISSVVKNILVVVSDLIKFDEDKLELELSKKEGDPSAIQDYSEIISTDTSGLEKILKVTFRIARFPIIISFVISFITLLIFLYLIN